MEKTIGRWFYYINIMGKGERERRDENKEW